MDERSAYRHDDSRIPITRGEMREFARMVRDLWSGSQDGSPEELVYRQLTDALTKVFGVLRDD